MLTCLIVDQPAIEHDRDRRSDQSFCAGSVFARGTARASRQHENRYELDITFTSKLNRLRAPVRQTYCLGTKIRTAAGCDP